MKDTDLRRRLSESRADYLAILSDIQHRVDYICAVLEDVENELESMTRADQMTAKSCIQLMYDECSTLEDILSDHRHG